MLKWGQCKKCCCVAFQRLDWHFSRHLCFWLLKMLNVNIIIAVYIAMCNNAYCIAWVSLPQNSSLEFLVCKSSFLVSSISQFFNLDSGRLSATYATAMQRWEHECQALEIKLVRHKTNTCQHYVCYNLYSGTSEQGTLYMGPKILSLVEMSSLSRRVLIRGSTVHVWGIWGV